MFVRRFCVFCVFFFTGVQAFYEMSLGIGLEGRGVFFGVLCFLWFHGGLL